MKPFSIILKAISKYIFVLINILALYLFFKGHNEPGGGFIAGVASALSFILLGLSIGYAETKKVLHVDPIKLAGVGLILAYITSLVPVFFNKPFLFHKMIHLHLPLLGDFHIGSPFLFDLGVYLTVVGVIVKMIFTFSDALEKDKS